MFLRRRFHSNANTMYYNRAWSIRFHGSRVDNCIVSLSNSKIILIVEGPGEELESPTNLPKLAGKARPENALSSSSTAAC